MNLNKAMIIGNLTRDPEVKSTPNGASVASFSVATNFIWTDTSGQKQEKAEYHNIVAWRKLADIIGQYLKKGSKVYIEGRLQTRDWTGQDGVKRYRTEIVADNMIMLDRAGTAPSAGNWNPKPAASSDIPTIQQDAPINNSESDSDEIKLEDIPF
ncbi:MAG: single-stranded DNA-binding protein [Candidatus Parcubacteria bacterium]|nr:single-stranded DNA-binding protein [Candidatus Parcubacteria bacterium]